MPSSMRCIIPSNQTFGLGPLYIFVLKIIVIKVILNWTLNFFLFLYIHIYELLTFFRLFVSNFNLKNCNKLVFYAHTLLIIIFSNTTLRQQNSIIVFKVMFLDRKPQHRTISIQKQNSRQYVSKTNFTQAYEQQQKNLTNYNNYINLFLIVLNFRIIW